MSLIGSVTKLARQYIGSVITDGKNVLGTAANPFIVSQSAGTIAPASVNETALAATVAAAAEQVTTGALSVALRTSILVVSGTKAFTLANGGIAGQRKTVYCRSAVSTPSGVLTPATPHNFATVTWGSTGTTNSFVELEWNGTGWDLVGIGGATPPTVA